MFRLLLAKFRLLGAKFGLRRVTLNSGVCLGYSVITIGHTGLGLGLVDSGVCFSYLVLSFGNFEGCCGFSGSRFGYFWARFLYLGRSSGSS